MTLPGSTSAPTVFTEGTFAKIFNGALQSAASAKQASANAKATKKAAKQNAKLIAAASEASIVPSPATGGAVIPVLMGAGVLIALMVIMSKRRR